MIFVLKKHGGDQCTGGAELCESTGERYADEWWSSAWGDNGYFYLSYYDTTIDEMIGLTADMGNEQGMASYDHIYQYDLLGNKSEIGMKRLGRGYIRGNDKTFS